MKTPIYIVGPCSAESREQVMETAEAISNLRFEIADFRLIFRAGVWKPRTSPHTFQGAGEEALAWLRKVKETYGMPVATEVATPEHVEAALQAGIDYLWIGARSSANPLAVQAIADALGSQNTEHRKNRASQGLRTQTGLQGVLIKNPVNADADLWLGNIERLEQAVHGAGCQVYAIHRGCNHQPCWAMAHKVRLARPDIPMLLDPSHMSGDAAQVPGLMDKISELGLDGAMVEVHCDPAAALSDKAQQITPEKLGSLGILGGLGSLDNELNWLRAEIDELDDRLWETIAARMGVSERIGAWKKAHGVAPLQPERYRAISEKLSVKSEELGLRKEFIENIWNTIHEESLHKQE